MGKTGSFEKIFIGREVKIGPWPSLVSCRPKQELNNSRGTLRLKFRTLAAIFNFQAPRFHAYAVLARLLANELN